VNDRSSRDGAALTIAGILADPAASFALKSVIRQWMTRDGVDAANDARMLCELFGATVDQRFRAKP